MSAIFDNGTDYRVVTSQLHRREHVLGVAYARKLFLSGIHEREALYVEAWRERQRDRRVPTFDELAAEWARKAE